MSPARVTVAADDLRTMATDTLVAAGLAEEHASTVADSFVWANLRGIDSHGMSRLPRYLELFEKGEAAKNPALTVERVRPAALLIDAAQAPGPVALSLAMREAITLARTTGVAWATVRGTVHTGAIGYYTTQAADAGMIGIGLVAGVPNMGYHGARGAAVATSPLSIAVPTGSDDFVLDMATATIALGKIAQYRARGEALPENAAVTAEGDATTDPALAKVPLPVGGPKGSGMSLAFELLSSALADNPIVAEYHGGTPEGRRHRQNASLIAVDVAAFLPLVDFETIAAATLAAVRGLTPSADAPVTTPGERSAQTAVQRGRDGISLAPKAWQSIEEAAARYGVAAPAPVA